MHFSPKLLEVCTKVLDNALLRMRLVDHNLLNLLDVTNRSAD
jgi:hypothetical protein